VACFGGYALPSYLLYGPDYARRVVYLRSTSPEELLRDLRREGVDVLYAVGDTAGRRAVLEEAAARGWLRRIAGSWYARVSRG
jgi:hypothetical protein